jgi:hypothetical protein
VLDEKLFAPLQARSDFQDLLRKLAAKGEQTKRDK